LGEAGGGGGVGWGGVEGWWALAACT